MKRFIYSLFLAIAVAALHSCVDDEQEYGTLSSDNDYISLDIVTGGLMTRATVADNELEWSVNHLDIVIFEESGEFKYSERVNVVPSYAGTIRLKTKRAGVFTKDAKYFVYVIANSTHPESTFADLADIGSLHSLNQVDERIHMTGSGIENAPVSFLMDGAAFPGSSVIEPSSPAAVVLYDGIDKEKTRLKVNLRRAAAKLDIVLYKGSDVDFVSNAHIGYYLRNLPYSTSVIPLASQDEKPQPLLRTPDKSTGRYFKWDADSVMVTAYLYSHSWENNEFFERGTSLIVNIPVDYDGKIHENSYYQIALRPAGKLYFKRNNYYRVSGTINAPGAEEETEPIVIEDLKYYVRDWTVVDVDVNGANAPKYLTVNHDTIKMHNVAVDSTTLLFSSSSDVTVKLLDNITDYPYYIDKFGSKQKYSGGGITAEAEGISGNITVDSPVPTNNTIRYFMFEVENAEGLKDTVWVEQYPLIYITNQLGWYSYRDDFKRGTGSVTTYEQKGSARYVSVGVNGTSWNGSYNYYTDSYNAGGWNAGLNQNAFWHSKVVTATDRNGKSTTSFYEWGANDDEPTIAGTCETSTNARMYHIRVTATSDKYKVGHPRITDGYTDPGADNAKLVSPSFMIASRLGAIYTDYGNLDDINDFSDYTIAQDGKITGTILDNNRNGIADRMEILREHCLNYVEVYKDENGNAVVLDDWRVPTKAEIDIIIGLQGTEDQDADAIDYLLNGSYYMSASGPAYNNKNDNPNANQSAIRCVRDAYVK